MSLKNDQAGTRKFRQARSVKARAVRVLKDQVKAECAQYGIAGAQRRLVILKNEISSMRVKNLPSPALTRKENLTVYAEAINEYRRDHQRAVSADPGQTHLLGASQSSGGVL